MGLPAQHEKAWLGMMLCPFLLFTSELPISVGTEAIRSGTGARLPEDREWEQQD